MNKIYTIIIERGENDYSAYVPDLPGCVVTGTTINELKKRIRDVIQMHLEGMREDGEPVPDPSTLCDYVETTATQKLRDELGSWITNRQNQLVLTLALLVLVIVLSVLFFANFGE
jgi:predicted RNase H-like HicB family nuclease